MHQVLLPDCSEAMMKLEYCANLMVHDFIEIVIPIMGGVSSIVEMAARFPKSKIRLLGSCDGILKNVLFFYTNKKKQPLSRIDKSILVKLGSAIARAMNLTLPIPSSNKYPLFNFEEIFFNSPPKNDDESFFNYENIKTEETPSGGLKSISFDFNKLIEFKVGEVVNESLFVSCWEEISASSSSDQKLLGVKLRDLMYDEEAAGVVRNIFGPDMPDSDTTGRKNFQCIHPQHNDTKPSMSICIKPMFWRNSTKMSDRISQDMDKALETLYRTGSYSASAKNIIIQKKADNAAICNNCNYPIITYVCKAICYSTKCKFASLLTNEQIKQLKVYYFFISVPSFTSACTICNKSSEIGCCCCCWLVSLRALFNT